MSVKLAQQTSAQRLGDQTQTALRALHIDPVLLMGLLAICLLSLPVLYSAGGGAIIFPTQQFVRLGIGFAALLLMAQVKPIHLLRAALPLYVMGILGLVAVFFGGSIVKGARRWLDFGFFSIQPAEFMKLILPLTLGALFQRWRTLTMPLLILVAMPIAGLPFLLIAEQPDLGTAISVALAAALAIFLAGVPLRLLLILAGLGAAVVPAVWHFLHDYQRQRLLTFLDPEADPLGSGYHGIQSRIAIGSGGLIGKGWLHGSQAQLHFLPERTTDFIFAVFGEEFGLIGLATLLGLCLLVCLRGLMIAYKAQTLFERILAGSISLSFFAYCAINMAMVTGMLPVVGIPLPLFSYGGTSTLVMLAGFGMIMSIHTHRKWVIS